MISFKKAMKFLTFVGVVLTISSVYCSAIPTNDKKSRVHEASLSSHDHNLHGEHNPDYDHDAFLGHDQAETFDQLSPEESQEKLAIIVDKIDKDKDGFVTEQELKEWIQYVQRRYIVTDTERMWKDHEPDSDDTLTWSGYQKRTFGYDEAPTEGSPTFEYKDMIERDERRWKSADKNKDGKLSKEEFQDFLHPEEAEHMRDIVVLETLEDIDKDGDGQISLEEYIADLWPRSEQEKGGEEPDWVKSEREQFKNYRDKDNNGKMDKAEVKEWIIPDDYDHSTAEARHLLSEADGSKDNKLTKEEILEKYDLFVGSQATDFGEALTRHDEF